MQDIDVIEDPAAAVVALDPIRSRLLAELKAPASAAALAVRLGWRGQKVNYHLRVLEAHGLVTLSGARRWGGLTEQTLRRPRCLVRCLTRPLGRAAVDPAQTSDRLSAAT